MRGRWFSPKAKGGHPIRNHGNCSQPYGWTRRTYMLPAPVRLLHPPCSVAVRCEATFVGRESGVCDTNIPHYKLLVVMVITDGRLHRAGSTKSRGARTTATANLGDKFCGDWGVATGTGGGYRWEYLVTSQHVGGLGVMVAHCRLGATTVFVSCLGDKVSLFRDSAAFST